MIVDYLQADHLPHVETDVGSVAIALYQEGISLKNPFYSFLSLYKAISIVFPEGSQCAKWIDEALDNIDEHRAKERRNAIAHAEMEPWVNPDEVDDHFRLQQDLPLLKNLAELAIEDRTGIQRPHTIWKERLYELEGFRELTPEGIFQNLVDSNPVPGQKPQRR